MTDKKRNDRVLGIAFGAVLLLAAFGVAMALTGSGGPAEATELAPVTITGDALVEFPAPGQADPGAGSAAPQVTGVGFDGAAVDLLSADSSTIVVFLAHWCPHCRREVPVLVDELGGNLPDGVRLVGVATATRDTEANYPPSAWLDSEDWPFEVLVDSKDYEAAAAYGVNSFPAFAVVGPDGTLLARGSGELSAAELAALVATAADAVDG